MQRWAPHYSMKLLPMHSVGRTKNSAPAHLSQVYYRPPILNKTCSIQAGTHENTCPEVSHWLINLNKFKMVPSPRPSTTKPKNCTSTGLTQTWLWCFLHTTGNAIIRSQNLICYRQVQKVPLKSERHFWALGWVQGSFSKGVKTMVQKCKLDPSA